MTSRCSAFILVFLAVLLFNAAAALAACTNPDGVAGQMKYNTDYQVVQYCDDTNWIAMGAGGTSTSGLAGWWKLDEASGTTAADSSGNGNDGTMQGGLDASNDSVSAVINTALDFDGTDDYIQTLSNDLKTANNFTLSVWFKADATNFAHHILWQGEGDENGWGFNCGSDTNFEMNLSLGDFPDDGQGETDDQLSFFIGECEGGENPDVLHLATAFSDISGWNHVAVVVSDMSTSPAASLYLNGSVVDTDTGTTAATDRSTWDTNFRTGFAGTGDRYFDGQIDDVRIYGRALSASEIQHLYDMGGPGSGLVGYWKLDETSGTTVVDSAGDSDGAWQSDDSPSDVKSDKGILDNAISLDGGDAVDLGQDPDFDFSGTNAFTISAWVYADDTSCCQAVFARGSFPGGSDNFAYHFGKYQVDGTRWITKISDGSSAPTIVTSVGTMEAGVWQHMVLTWDGTDLILYKDATSIGSSNQPGFSLWDGGSVDAYRETGIGFNAKNDSNHWNGKIDNVRVYDRALSASEVTALYEMGFPCASPNGREGHLLYNTDSHVLTYCNRQGWQAMGPVPGSGGSGCSNPTDDEGVLVYNSDFSVMQYCDGTNWIAVGK